MATGSYTTHLKVRELSAHEAISVVGESIGTGNGSATVFYIDNYPIVDANADEVITVADVIVYVDGTPVTVSAIDAAIGKLTLAGAPGSDTAVTADYRYSDVSETAIEDAVLYGESEAESLTGRKYTDANSQTDYFDGHGGTDKTFQLRKFPVQSITNVYIREPGKVSWESQTLATGDGSDDDYWGYITDGDSYIEFVVAPYKGNQNVKIEYTYGYSSVPSEVVDLVSCLAALYIHIVVDAGWSIKSYRLVEQEVAFGEGSPHGTAMRQLKGRINYLLGLVGKWKYVGII